MEKEQYRSLTPEALELERIEEAKRREKEIYLECNFRSSMTEYDCKEAGLPKIHWAVSKQDIHPDHISFIKEYVKLWTVVDEGRKSADHGLILHGTEDVCLKYMSFILQRVYLRKRDVYCGQVFNLEEDCKNQEKYQYLSEKADLLGVYGFPFFLHGAPAGRDDLCVTMFHRMILNRRSNMLPTIFVSSKNLEDLTKLYSNFPSYMVDALTKYNNSVGIVEKSSS